MIKNNFAKRHIGPNQEDVQKMLKVMGEASVEDVIDKAIPAAIRFKEDLDLEDGMNEYEFLNHMKGLASKNKIYTSFIGMGYYNTITPAVLQRNILENPGWYTSYTPYQAEISQGRLETLFTFQTLITDMTGMTLTNGSMLDEATSAAETMLMFFGSRSREQVRNNVVKFFVADDLFPQNIEVIKTRAIPKGIELVFGNPNEVELDSSYFGAIVQYTNTYGEIRDYSEFVKKAKENNIFVSVIADLMSLAMIEAPGVWGADAVCGTTQRFGVPMGYGGPHAGYFACTDQFKRNIPGRIIGKSVDAQGNKVYRLALQTREQHIKREKATSNICTASVLVAIVAGQYAAWHGKEGITEIANDINQRAKLIADQAKKYGFTQENKHYFDTITFSTPEGVSANQIIELALEEKMNLRPIDENRFSISVDETTTIAHVNTIASIFAKASNKNFEAISKDDIREDSSIPASLVRKTDFLSHAIFNTYHSETDMMRYLKKMEVKDLSLNRAMIPLGSCTMKLNAAMEMIPFTWPEFAGIHPFVPVEQAQGYIELIDDLDRILSKITGFEKMSFQPNSGASGEYAGLIAIRNYHIANNSPERNICLIPSSAHGTNPASAAMAGMEIVIVKADENGEVDVNDLREKAEKHKDNLSCTMITYPSTHGVFEEGVLEIINIIHENGGLVYMDGANMNAQVGYTSPGYMGADVCHLNLHKTFAMPHGGGGPGVGPIGVNEKLVNFLPSHSELEVGGKQGSPVSSAPYGSAQLLVITYGYLKMLGRDGVKEATKYAILNANYLMTRLKDSYKILYTGAKGMVAHEIILDCNPFSLSSGVQVGDIAKRLMDYGFHAPTVAFPVHGTLMVEPTESEPLSEMDRLCDALIKIREEIREIEEGKADKANNIIKNAPHTMQVICADEWDRPYTRQEAAFPLPHDDKYWPGCGKVDDAYGDRNLVCCYLDE